MNHNTKISLTLLLIPIYSYSSQANDKKGITFVPNKSSITQGQPLVKFPTSSSAESLPTTTSTACPLTVNQSSTTSTSAAAAASATSTIPAAIVTSLVVSSPISATTETTSSSTSASAASAVAATNALSNTFYPRSTMPKQNQVYTWGRMQGDNPYKTSSNIDYFDHIVKRTNEGKILSAIEVDPRFVHHYDGAFAGAKETLNATLIAQTAQIQDLLRQQRPTMTKILRDLSILMQTTEHCSKKLTADTASSMNNKIDSSIQLIRTNLQKIEQEYGEQIKYLEEIQRTLLTHTASSNQPKEEQK